ncbi:MAG: M15 family metallopeptidase [Syntrophomonadaceae bacterium]
MSRKFYCVPVFLFVFSSFLFAQTDSLKAQSDTSIVLLKSIDSTIVTDVRYATANNFTHKVLYPTANVYLRKAAALKLHEAEKELISKYNLRLKVYDGYRPLSVQKKLWEIMPDSRYVANPKNGSRHNRGAAVDLTLIDSTGRELEMGTPYDDFTDKAHRDYRDLPENVLKNRRLLEDVMVKYGFEPLSTEWWHFDYSLWKNYSILDEEIR